MTMLWVASSQSASQAVDSHGFDSEYIPDRKSVASRGYLEITVKDPWIMVSIDGSGQKGGAAPGSYILQIPILVEFSKMNGSQPQQVRVNSDPIPIQVVAKPEPQGCE